MELSIGCPDISRCPDIVLGKVSDLEGSEEIRAERVFLMDCFWFEVMLRL